MQEGDVQADAPEEERAASVDMNMATAGVAQEARRITRRGEGRRVTLVRTEDGQYQVWMGTRMIQSFCAEWEDITRFQLPEGIEQQVRVNVSPMGDAHESRQRGVVTETAVEVAQDIPPGARLRVEGDEDLLGMFRELPAHNRELIANQIRANHLQEFGVALTTMAHPNRLVAETIENAEEERVPQGLRNQTMQLIHRELERIGNMVETLSR